MSWPVYHPGRPGKAALIARKFPKFLGDHQAAVAGYVPDQPLVAAVNTALVVGAPLLLTGEPGTGKTGLAWVLAAHFETEVFQLRVKSTTQASDLSWSFDEVKYFHEHVDKATCVTDGPLTRAYRYAHANGHPAVMLIDEIDKAQRDFPNDLLDILDEHTIEIPQTGEKLAALTGSLRPVIIITSNGERRLPDAFLRRCVAHHIAVNETHMRHLLNARFPDLGGLVERVVERFLALRDNEDLRKKPGPAELLTWIAIHRARGDLETALDLAWSKLETLGALVKDPDDRKRFAEEMI